MSKIVLIGANHGGTAAANTILDTYPEHKLTVFDKNSNISYLGCGTALWVGRQIPDPNGLFYCSRDILQRKGATVHMETEVYRVDYENKKVYAKAADGSEIVEDYDKLILATGSKPITPDIPGKDLKNVRFVKLFQDGGAIDASFAEKDIQNVAVVGAGYIGVEIAEAAKRRGKNVRLFDMASGSLPGYYDSWFTDDMDKNLDDHGISLHFEETLSEIQGTDGKVSAILTNKGVYNVDMVILAIGFIPNSDIGQDKIDLFENGAFLVNTHQETSLKDVYAIGDCATVLSNATQKPAYIALATNAVRSGIVAAHNVCGTPLESIGVQGSNGISIFGLNMVSTGLNMEAAKQAGFNAHYTEFEDLQKPAFIKEDNDTVKIRIVYDKDTRRVLGAQLSSRLDITMGIHMFSLAIQKQTTIEEISLLDIFFLPHFNQPYNYITMAGLSAE